MKKIIIFLYCLPFLTFAQTKLDRSKAPDPLKAKTINVESPQSFVMPNGLKVFVVQNTKLPTVSFTLLVDMLPIYYKYAGIEDLAGSMLKAGTRKYTKEKLDEEIEFLGGQINAGHNYISGNCLNNNFPKLFELFSDICLNPSFPKEELEKQKKQLLSNIESNKEDPNVIANNVRAVLMYGKNHPYGQIATKTSVEKIDVEDIVQNYNTYWKPSISYLVFVGDISLEEAKTLCNKYLNNWQGQAPEFVKYPFPTLPESRTVAIVNRPQSVQSVIGVFNAIDLKKSSPDRLATQVLNTVLGAHASSRLFMNLREKHGFTYGAYSRITDDRYVGNFRTGASVRNEKTDSAIGEFLNEIKRIRTEKVSPEELSFAVKYMSGEFSRSFESPNTIADFALNIERFNLPKDYYKNYLQSLDKITADQIEQAANKYL
ncbi:MAG: pitrilysin family protein, partial [Alphaproteobacteria bacterium]|nr:pitrilysin family protein [Alphaproteobacteria bacterium]